MKYGEAEPESRVYTSHPADPSSNLSTDVTNPVLQKALVMFEGIIKAAKNRR